jgi:hypothetical protein
MAIITIDDFATSPTNRENIVILSQQDFGDAMKTYEVGKFLLNDEICYLVKPDDVAEVKQYPALQKLYKGRQLKPGNILILDDEENDSYLSYDSLLKRTVELQLNKFNELCQLMGAKKVILSYISSTKENEKMKLEAEATVKGAFNAKTGVKSEIISNILGSMETVTVFTGNSIPNIDKAKKLMATGIFSNNNHITSFFDKACHIENRMISETVTVKLAEEVSKKLEVFAKIDAPIFKKSIGEVNFEKVKNASCVSEISYEVFF